MNISHTVFDNTTTVTETFENGPNPTWRLEYIVLVVMITSLAIIGILGNIPVLIVYFRRRDNLPTHTFIKVLAFIDLIVCSVFMPYTIVYELHLVTSDIMCRVCEFLRHCTLFASTITLVAIATERYIAVCKINIRLNVHNINIGVWIIFGFSVILAVPAVGTFGVVYERDVEDIPCHFPHIYTPGRFCHFTYSLMGKPMVTAYQILQATISFILILTLTNLYTIIYFVLWKRAALKRKMIEQRGENGKTGSNASSENQGRRCPCKRNSPCCGACAHSDPSYQNSEMWSDLISNGLEERDCGSNEQSNSNGIDKPDTYYNTKPTRRKIRFCVSAQSGRSEKLKRVKQTHKRTAKMLFLCTVIYIITWVPFWFDVFGVTDSLILRHLFFIGNGSNPIVYGITNEEVRRAFKRLFWDCWKRCGVTLRSDCEVDSNNKTTAV